MSLKELEKKINHTFKNEALLKEAMTHRSYLNENHSWPVPHNERLEFLGDAVLELVVTEELYNRYPKNPEGWMTSVRAALVNTHMLSTVAHDLDLGSFVLMSKGESKDSGRARDAILANSVEAIIGAIHLDSDYATVKKFIMTVIFVHLEEVLEKKLYIDAKSLLQEKAQSTFKLTPNYKVLKATGPDHEKTFTIGVYFNSELIADGVGKSKQDGEVLAAQKALELLEAGKIKL